MNQVTRQRLVDLIEQGVQGKLTLISAPAGFGKTTILSQWIRQTAYTTAWLSLDELDNDSVRFWRYVSKGLANALPTATGNRIEQLAHKLPNLSINTFLDALINELHTANQPTALLLDDYHVIEETSIHDGLSYFIEHIPQQIHLLISSRNELPFPTVKWRVRDEITIIDTQQLKFTLPESEAFYQETAGLTLSTELIAHLFYRTEGWITGLQLFSISLRSEADYEPFIANITGYNRNVADYLFHEVIAKLPEDIQDFLLCTSVLERLDAKACNDITLRSDGIQMLEKLKEWNLFLLPLDDHDIWYRYHHLFAEFLRNLAKRKHPDLWLSTNLLASSHLAERGLMDEAIDHAFAANEYIFAETLLSRHISNVLQRGEFPTLLKWFDSLTTHASLSPEMSLIYAFILVVTGQAESAGHQLNRVEQQFHSMEYGEARQQLQSGLLFVKSNLVFASGQFEQWFSFTAAILDEFLPHNSIFYNFNYNKTDPLVRRNAFGLKGVLSKDTEAIGKLFSNVLEKHGWEDSLINLYLIQSLAEGFYEWNRLEESQDLLHKLESVARLQQIPGLFVPNRITQAHVYWANGQPELSHAILEEAISIVLKLAETHWVSYLRACQSQLYLLQGQLPAAKKAMSILRISAKERPTFNKEFEYLALSRLLGAQHKELDALRLLELLKPQAQRENSLMCKVEISIIQACLQENLGQRSQALAALHDALVIGEANGYIRSFIDAGQVMAKLLVKYLDQKSRSDSLDSFPFTRVSNTYIQKLLEAFPSKQKQETAFPSPALIEELTRTEHHLLKLIHQGESNKQIADKLNLSVGTVKVYVSRLYSKLDVSSRTQALVKAQELQLLHAQQ
ncbi:LuxR C-terminal-related transcriptional regulator [Paenibacillus psychroresistens]|nr:LuxR C-terminal-related transcriptional regulator [Paenibacillus psychroresistens]